MMKHLLRIGSKLMIAALLALVAGCGPLVRAAQYFVYFTIEEIECPDGSTSAVRARWAGPQGEQSIPVTRTGEDSWIINLDQADPPPAQWMRSTHNSTDRWQWRDLEDDSYKVIDIRRNKVGFVVDSPYDRGADGNFKVGQTFDAGYKTFWIDGEVQIEIVQVTISELDDSDCDGIPDIEDVPEPSELIETLIADLDALVDVQKGIKNSLVVKLNAALAALNVDDTVTACASLQDFINHSRAQQAKKLPTEVAASLIGGAEAIRELIGCL
jgi:hypothetical protein